MSSEKAPKDELTQLKDENDRLKKSIEDLWTINQLARIISTTLPVNQILDKVVSGSVKAIGAAQGAISLLDEKKTDDPFKTLIRKVDETDFTKKYRLDEDLSGWMIKNRKALLINDFKNSTFKGKHSTVEKIHSILSVPLLCKGKLIGVLSLFNKKNNREFSKNDQRLLSIIASQSAQVIENARLYEQEKQLRQFEQELEMAQSIQNRLLPKESPEIAGIDLAGISYAAKEVGGDYFDFIELENGRWGIALGDVSGKGIPAALLMANLQATLRNQALNHSSIVECIAKANQFLYLNTESHKFATLFFGVLDSKTKNFNYINAGHNFPFHLLKDGEFRQLEIGGLVVGIAPDSAYNEGKVHLSSGEIIVIYSDGVTEAEDASETLFGEQRLQEIIKKNKNLSSQKIMAEIYKEVKNFQGGTEQDDDITLVVIKAT
ncbi:SpoIIE family protein phosphatase [candidate division KSB1 bacterium]|nr:SpoIIE family protein phosphatase [candidate division KSB1 bacterium]